MSIKIEQNNTVTRKFNDALLPIIQKTPPPAYKGKYVKIKFCTQLPTSLSSIRFFL